VSESVLWSRCALDRPWDPTKLAKHPDDVKAAHYNRQHRGFWANINLVTGKDAAVRSRCSGEVLDP